MKPANASVVILLGQFCFIVVVLTLNRLSQRQCYCLLVHPPVRPCVSPVPPFQERQWQLGVVAQMSLLVWLCIANKRRQRLPSISSLASTVVAEIPVAVAWTATQQTDRERLSRSHKETTTNNNDVVLCDAKHPLTASLFHVRANAQSNERQHSNKRTICFLSLLLAGSMHKYLLIMIFIYLHGWLNVTSSLTPRCHCYHRHCNQ